MKRVLIAVALAAGIYAIAVGVGSLLYATDTIATGATHTKEGPDHPECGDYKKVIAEERGIHEEDVPQGDVRARAITCVDSHELTERDAFTTEYLFGAIWPAGIVAVIYLIWPWWAGILHRQQLAEDEMHEAPVGT